MSAWQCRARSAASAAALACAIGSVHSTPERGETFRVDYLVFSLIVLAVLAACLYLIRLPGEVRLKRRPEELAARAQQRRKRPESEPPEATVPRAKAVLQRELKKVPTPWGWPGSNIRHGHEPGGGTGSLKGWIDHLIAEKRTVEDDEYRQHNSEALRSMLEDRFGHAAQPTRMKYSKVKPPRLADPNRPHDQMDNFPSGRTDAIVSKLSKQPGKAGEVARSGPFRKTAGLENIKKPWGW
jgi:hypothetical protein